MTPVTRNCAIWAVCWVVQAPNPKTPKIAFLGPQNSRHRDLEIFMPGHWFTSVVSKIVKFLNKWPKGLVAFLPMPPKNTHFCAIWWNHWGDFCQIFVWYPTVVPYLYSEFCLNRFRFGELWLKTPSLACQSDYNMGSFGLIIMASSISPNCNISITHCWNRCHRVQCNGLKVVIETWSYRNLCSTY